ncbi:MAG: ferredoxin [Candidatus Shikimatogenerans bostrichidophilus]|nr:MAG: ferredoxin [Candidatus Shikimatogenerans bostrichidophilus]
MITIIYKRDKCIGCNSCVLVCPLFFSMSKIDGKSVLLKSKLKKRIYILKNIDNVFTRYLSKATKICPVKIIKIIRH